MKKHDMAVGYKHLTKNCGKVEIVEYVNASKVLVRFVGYTHIVCTTADRIRKGKVKNVMLPSLCKKGYLDVGKYSATTDKKAYQVWTNMFQRCYSEKYQLKQPTYSGCTVCKEWFNFQVFAKWFYKISNYVEGLQLDKDIKIKNNKIYSPETCIFIPQSLNLLIRTHENLKEEGCPVGVYYNKRNKCFRANIYYEGSQNNLGEFTTSKEAIDVYKKAREERIKWLVLNNTYPEATPYLLQHI